MTLYRTFLTLSAMVAFGASPRVRAQQPTATTPLVFDGVTVIDVQSGQRLPAQRVVIVGSRIQTMGSVRTVQIPTGARVVDARGKYLIPGLWDMHTHSRRYTDFFYPLFIANGVTGIRDAWSEVPLDTLIMWRQAILAGKQVGPPRQLFVGPALDEAPPCKRSKDQGHICVADSAEARHVVDSLKAAGANAIKTYNLGRNMYFVIVAEARRVGLPVGGHLEEEAGTAIEASDSGVSILDHHLAGIADNVCLGLNDSASVGLCQPIADRFKRNGTWWVPTLTREATVIHGMGGTGYMLGKVMEGRTSNAIFERSYQFAHDFWAGSVQHRLWLDDSASVDPTLHTVHGGLPIAPDGFLRVMHSAGLPILAGTDVGAPVMQLQLPGFSLHNELAVYVTEGLTPLEALQTATLNPAKYLHGTDSLGTVAPGKLADLVLLDGDPLVDITNTSAIRAVVANGRYFDRAALDQLMTDVQAKAKQEPQPLGDARK